MKIKELANVFHGSVVIERTHLNGKSLSFEELYDGKLAKLTDESILNEEIKVIENIVGSTTRGGIPFLKIVVK